MDPSLLITNNSSYARILHWGEGLNLSMTLINDYHYKVIWICFSATIDFPVYKANAVNEPPIIPEISMTTNLGTDNRSPNLPKTIPFNVRSKKRLAPNQ